MEEQTKDLRDYLSGFRRHKKVILAVTVLVFLISAAVAALLPASYRSAATILIEQQEIPPDLVRSTISSYADQRIQVISRQVMTRVNLMRIVETYNLYPRHRATMTTEEIVERLTKAIKLDLLKADVIDSRGGGRTNATIAFTLTYEGETPAVVQKVANELATLFLSQNIKIREEKTAETSTFLAEEAGKLSAHVSETEAKLAKFKEKHAGRLPELVQLNLQLRDRTDSELKEVERLISALEERQFYLEAQLAQMEPNAPPIAASGERMPNPADRLRALNAHYASLSSVYSSDHPDMVKARRMIEALQKEVGGAVDAQAQPKQPAPGSAGAPAPKAENPAYVALQTQLEGNRVELKSLRTKRPVLQSKLASYDQRLEQTPQVEREYLELTRDHEASLTRYREIRSKQMQADIGQELEKDRKGERFSLIDPPQLPEKPSSPNRPAILLVGLILAVGSGLGSALVLEGLDDSVRSSRALAEMLDVPLLAVIPFMDDSAKNRRQRVLVWTVALSSVAALALLALLAVHFLFIPLDVLWFRALRWLGQHVPALASIPASPAELMGIAWSA